MQARAAIEMCHSGALTFTYCPHSALSAGEIPGICAKMAVHACETFSRAMIQTWGGGSGNSCGFTNWLYQQCD